MTAHNGIVYETSKTKPFARGLPYVAISRATDHFINKIFTAENIEITEFYNKLNFFFDTDEEI